jgi:solute carrier family 25 aspartate/glutamate transporter 12/13
METFGNALISGYVGAICVYPIDFVKTRVQNNQSLINLIKNTTIKDFYKGSIIQLIGIGPEKAIKIYMNKLVSNNEFIKKKCNNYTEIIAGACAGASQVLVTNPIEIIKIQYQMNLTQNKSLFDIIKSTNYYKGSSLCLMRDIPFSVIYFPTYNYLKKDYNNFIAGTLAGIPSAYLVTPFDVIKTRYQMKNNNHNIFDCVKKIYYDNGFWRGGMWRVLKSAPQFGITLYVFELLSN